MTLPEIDKLTNMVSQVLRGLKNFDKIREPPNLSGLVGRCRDACESLIAFDLSKVPQGLEIDEIHRLLSQLLDTCSATIKDGPGIARSLGATVPNLEDHTMRIVPYAFVTSHAEIYKGAETYLQNAAEELKQAAQKDLESIQSLTGQAETLVGKAQTLYEKAQETLRTASVATHAGHFETRANSARHASWAWLTFAIVLAGGTIWVAFDLLQIAQPTATSVVAQQGTGVDLSQMISFLAVRVFVLSILTYGITFCARNYSSNRHNFTVNSHRKDALSSFEAFVQSTDIPAVKDAVLLQATQAIFSPQSTGYGKAGESAPPLSPWELIGDVLRGQRGK